MSADSLNRELNRLYGNLGMAQMDRRYEKLRDRWDRIHDAEWGGKSNLAQWHQGCDIREQMGSCISVSLESLHCARALIEGAEAVAPQYAVIRTAIEASSTGLWLSHVGKKNKMIFYSLKLAYRDNSNIMDAAALLGESRNRGLLDNRKKAKLRLEEQKRGLKGYSNRNIASFPSYTQIAKRSDEIVKKRMTYKAELAWKICSGMAHGSRDLIIGLAETIPTGVFDEKTMEVTIKQNTLLSAAIMNPAMENCEELMQTYEEACIDATD